MKSTQQYTTALVIPFKSNHLGKKFNIMKNKMISLCLGSTGEKVAYNILIKKISVILLIVIFPIALLGNSLPFVKIYKVIN